MNKGITSGGFSPEMLSDNLAWTIEDVATELHCSVRHIHKLISEDRIPFARVGRLVRFSPARICGWLHKGGTR